MRISAGMAIVCFIAMPLVVPRPFIKRTETEAAALKDIARRLRDANVKYGGLLKVPGKSARVEKKQLAAQARPLPEKGKYVAVKKAPSAPEESHIKSLRAPPPGRPVSSALVAEVKAIAEKHPDEGTRARARGALKIHESRNAFAIEQVNRLGSRADPYHILRVKEMLTEEGADEIGARAAVLKLDREDEARQALEAKLREQARLKAARRVG
ncbi:hypothetical protein FRB93_008265 [Tulasnella sp. JGI-2019a]|nr:hypothetical protein FRB93_008265 [Tulasnella sp. JGI-2019a]